MVRCLLSFTEVMHLLGAGAYLQPEKDGHRRLRLHSDIIPYTLSAVCSAQHQVGTSHGRGCHPNQADKRGHHTTSGAVWYPVARKRAFERFVTEMCLPHVYLADAQRAHTARLMVIVQQANGPRSNIVSV